MKVSLLIEILVLCALVAFGAARVIDSRINESPDFAARLIANVSKSTDKLRQNEISGADYDDPVGSTEIVVGEEDLINNSVTVNEAPAVSAVAEAVASAPASSVDDNSVALATDDITEAPVNVDDAHPLNKYCTCNQKECNCCREFKLPLVSVRGPGCATLRYLGKNRMSVAIKYGDITLTQRTISGRKAPPVCVNLPGGFSQFCGRVYGISRESDDFQACLGLELRADEEVEAALRVSCFKFGPKGLKMTDAKPLPPVAAAIDDEDDDDDGAGGLLGLVTGGASDDDEDDYEDDDNEGPSGQDATTGDEDADLLGFADEDEDEDDDDDEDDDEADEADDYDDDAAPAPAFSSGFSLLDGIFGEEPSKKTKKPVQTRNKVNTPAEDAKDNAKDNAVDVQVSAEKPKDTVAALDPVDLEHVEAAVEAAAAKPVSVETPSIITELQSNAGVPLVSTTKKPKKKPAPSFLDTIESLIGGDDDDDEDDDEEEPAKDEAEDDDEEDEDEAEDDDEEEEEEAEEAVEKDEEENDDEEEEEVEEEKDEDEDEDAEENDQEEEDEEEKEEDEDEEAEANAEETTTTDKESAEKTSTTEKKPKKKPSGFGGFFARLMKFI